MRLAQTASPSALPNNASRPYCKTHGARISCAEVKHTPAQTAIIRALVQGTLANLGGLPTVWYSSQ